MQRRSNTARVLPRTIQYAIMNELYVLTLYNPRIFNDILVFLSYMSPFVGIILLKAWIFMSSQISYKDNKNRITKKLSFIEGGHQLEKLEFALAIAQTNGDEKKSIILRKKIVELGGNTEEPGT